MADDNVAKTCSICTVEIEADERFVSCSGSGGSGEQHHFHSDGGCFDHFLATNAAEKGVLDHWQKHQSLACPCFNGGCAGSIDEHAVLVGSDQPPEMLKLFVETVRSVACAVDRKETLAHAAREAMKNSDEAKANFTKRVVEDVIQLLSTALACPHCSAPFLEFDGCLALTCGSCAREFCGVCLRKHKETDDGHEAVKSHIDAMGPDTLKRYGFHSSYFISGPGWKVWAEKLRMDAVCGYMRSVRNDVAWEAFPALAKALRDGKHVGESFIRDLERVVYSHEQDTVHLIRLPVVFWLLYSAKHNVTFDQAMKTVSLDSTAKKDLGLRVVNAVRTKHPHWQTVRARVPGESFEAINYPPEVLPEVARAIEGWGKVQRYW